MTSSTDLHTVLSEEIQLSGHKIGPGWAALNAVLRFFDVTDESVLVAAVRLARVVTGLYEVEIGSFGGCESLYVSCPTCGVIGEAMGAELTLREILASTSRHHQDHHDVNSSA